MPTSKRSRSASNGAEVPVIDPVVLADLVDGDAESLQSRESHDAERFEGADLTDYDLEGSSFTECLLESLSSGGAKWRGSRFVECIVTDPFAPVFDAPRTTWHSVRVERPRWGSAALFDSEFKNVHLVGGKIDYLNLRSSQLTDVVIEGCSIGELDLGGVRATRVALVDCRIGMLDVTGATLRSFDLRSTELGGVSGVDGLRGAVVDQGQLMLLAPLLAGHLGLVVE